MELTWHLPAQIAVLLERRGISQRELARRCEFSPGTITELANGRRCSPEVMGSLGAKLAETEAERYSLLCAHLRDEVVRCNADPTHVVIRHVEGADLNGLDLTPEMNAYIGTLAREAETDKNVAAIIEALGDVLVERVALRADLAAQAANLVEFPKPMPRNADLVAEEPAPYAVQHAKKTPPPREQRPAPPVPKPPATG